MKTYFFSYVLYTQDTDQVIARGAGTANLSHPSDEANYNAAVAEALEQNADSIKQSNRPCYLHVIAFNRL